MLRVADVLSWHCTQRGSSCYQLSAQRPHIIVGLHSSGSSLRLLLLPPLAAVLQSAVMIGNTGLGTLLSAGVPSHSILRRPAEKVLRRRGSCPPTRQSAKIFWHARTSAPPVPMRVPVGCSCPRRGRARRVASSHYEWAGLPTHSRTGICTGLGALHAAGRVSAFLFQEPFSVSPICRWRRLCLALACLCPAVLLLPLESW